MDRESVTSVSLGFLCIVLVAMIVQTFLLKKPALVVRETPKAPVEDCIGTPIFVDAAYEGNTVDEWSCKVQCDDKIQHYLSYTNGVGTPCERLPGCLDYGEDHGIQCRIPGTGTGTTAAEADGAVNP